MPVFIHGIFGIGIVAVGSPGIGAFHAGGPIRGALGIIMGLIVVWFAWVAMY